MSANDQLVLITTITERGCGNRVTDLYTANQVYAHLRCEGEGTATSEIMDILGLGSSEKDIIFSLAPRQTAVALFEQLGGDQHGAAGRGIAFTLPLSAVSNLLATIIRFKTKIDGNDGGNDMHAAKNTLILVSVNQGFSDEVMATARATGARGGTVVRGRWVGEENFEQNFPDFGAEREILAIVAPTDTARAIMEAVNAKHGMATKAAAILCSVGIEQTTRLG